MTWNNVSAGETGPVSYRVWEKAGGANGIWADAGSAISRIYTDRDPATDYQYKVEACNQNATPLCSESPVATINFPAAPGDITLSNITNTGRDYTLNWPAAAGTVDSYQLQKSFDGGQNWSNVINQDGVDLTESVSSAALGASLQYRVRACNSQACGEYGPVKTYWVPQAPELSIDLDTDASSLTVSWPASGAAHFELERSVNGGAWQSVDTAYPTTEYEESIALGSTYAHRVRACNAEGICSNPVETQTTVPPGAPAVIEASQPAPAERHEIAVSWWAPAGTAEGYRLEREDLTAGGGFTLIATLDGEGTTDYADTNVQPDHQYQYRVRAYAGDTDGAYSPVSNPVRVHFTRPVVHLTTDGATQPDGVVHGAGYAGIYTVQWFADGSADSFTVTEREPGGSWQDAAFSAVQCATDQCDYDKADNTGSTDQDYQYKAQACNVDYCSDEQTLTVRVRATGAPGQPTGFTYQYDGPVDSDGDYTLQWNAPANSPPNATGAGAEAVSYYELERTNPVAGPWQFSHGDTQSAPYTRSFDDGSGGQSYQYTLTACYQDGGTPVCSVAAPLTVDIPFPAPDQAGALSHSAMDAQTGSYTLQWGAASGEVSQYELQQLSGDDQWLDFDTATATDYAVTGHANGGQRRYRVRACNADDCGGYTAAHTVYVPHLEPGTPTGLTDQGFEISDGRLTLAWTAPSAGGEVQIYEIQQSTDGSNWGAPFETAAINYTTGELTNGTTYHYRIRACNVDECGAYTDTIEVYFPYAAPDVPGSLAHQDNENDPVAGEFTIHWTAPETINTAIAPITYYQLEYSANRGDIWQAAPTGGTTPGHIDATQPVAGDPASATLSGLTAGVAYSVRARACNPDGCSNSTEPYQLRLPHPAPGLPVVLPPDPTTEDHAARRFAVAWAPPETGTVDHYQLQQNIGTSEEPVWRDIVRRTPANAYTLTNRSYGETYYYRVRACSEPGGSESSDATDHCSQWAEVDAVRLKYPRPNAPSGTVVGNIDHANGDYELTWNGVLGWAPRYRYELEQALPGTPPDSDNWIALEGEADDGRLEQTGYQVEDQPSGDYIHRVRACNPDPDHDCGDWSPPKPVTVLATPAKPNSIDVDAGFCRFNVTWTPPSGTANGQYRYELERRIGSGSWQNLLRTSGTSHDMLLNSGNDDDDHAFRVRVRSLKNGFYGPWSQWRTASAVSAMHCEPDSAPNYIGIKAPKFSETGRYDVSMRAGYTGEAGTRAHGISVNNGSYTTLSDNDGTWTEDGNYDIFTVHYGSSNAQPTGRYRYRMQVCYANEPGPPGAPPEEQCDQFTSTTSTTTVLHDPGGVGPLQLINGPSLSGGVYKLVDGEFELSWSAASNPGSQATQDYEIQYKRADTTDWTFEARENDTDFSGTVHEFGVPYNYRVRACRSYADYVNCGAWAELGAPVVQTVGTPRFAVNTYPRDGELVIYDRSVPVQWLPPSGLAKAGELDHYRISLRSRHVDEDGNTYWLGPEPKTNVAHVGGSESDPYVHHASVQVAGSGLKEFQVRACGSPDPATCGEAMVFQISVIVPPEPPTPTEITGESDPDPAGDAFNGALSGEFSVTPSGATTYSLPITVPPGTAGVQPDISLAYSSQAGNGIAGWGWSIGGLSAISRCNKTRTQDGEFAAINYSDEDAFCLDGQRLIEIADNEYRVEQNDFRRITRQTGGHCGAWFRIETQSGETLEYGKTGGACIEATTSDSLSVVTGWALDRVIDVSGNYMTYAYTNTPSEHGGNALTIDSIEYTGHSSTDGPYAAVDFEYEQRPDPIQGYRAGVYTQQHRRLTTVRTSTDGSTVGRYELNYAGDDDPVPGSRLASVYYCAIDADDGMDQCMEPLTFTWHRDEPGWSRMSSSWRPPKPFVDENGENTGARLIDLDGDGRVDLLYSATDDDALAYRNTGHGWQLWNAAALPPGTAFVDDEGRDQGVRFADLNGDGRADILVGGDDSQPAKAYLFTGTGWESTTAPDGLQIVGEEGNDLGVRFADIDNNGRTDLARGYDGEGEIRYNRTLDGTWTYGPWAPEIDADFVQPFKGVLTATQSMLMDVNRDGLTDVLSQSFGPEPHFDRLYWVYLNDGTDMVRAEEYDLTVPANSSEYPDIGVRVVDFNGDGLSDVVVANDHQRWLVYNSGRGWDCCWTVPDGLQFVDDDGGDPGVRLADINADGYVDILKYSTALLNPSGRWQPDTGGDWHREPRYALPVPPVDGQGRDAGVRLIDVDGDGQVDLLHGRTGQQHGAWRSHASRYEITAFNDALGNTTQVQYKTLTETTLDGRNHPIYTGTDRDLDHPREKQGGVPMRVVDRVHVNDGIGGTLTTEYTYRGLTAVTGGRGMQGFESMTAYKPDGTVVTTRYEQDFPYTGMPRQVTVTHSDSGLVLNETTYEYCFVVTSPNDINALDNPENASFRSDQHHDCGDYDSSVRGRESVFVFTRSSTEINNRLNTDLNDIAATVQVDTETVYGRYGYPLESTVTTTGDNKTYEVRTEHDYNSPAADSQWHGLVSETRATRSQSNDSSTTTTQFFYDNSSGLLTREIAEPYKSGSPVQQAIAYAYDRFGNRVETTVCAENVTACEADPGAPNTASSGRSTTTVYDARGRFPIETINAVDHRETREYAHPLGLKTRHVGPNSVETRWQYDALGRKTAKVTPFGTTKWKYLKAGNGFVRGARYRVDKIPPSISTSDGEQRAAPVSRAYYDGKGRERRTLTRNVHGEWVAGDAEYDRFGRVERESEPYFVYSTSAVDAHWTVNHYDDLDRLLRVEVPLGDVDNDGADDGMGVVRTEYKGFETEVIDAKGRYTVTQVDALGRTIRKVEDRNGRNIETRYTYDSRDNLETTIVDADPATTVTIDYDLRDRKVSMDDPDMGDWTYEYNGFGELVRQQDAKDQVTEIDYDKLGRKTERRETDTDGTTHVSSWVYDAAPGAGIGKLYREYGPQGTSKCYAYDELGQQLSATTSMGDCSNDDDVAQRFTVRKEYDGFGRLSLIHYPQAGMKQLTVQNVYSRFGGLWYVRDISDPDEPAVYWIADTLDARGQVMQETLRNQNTISREYNAATGWLKKIESWDVDLNMIQRTRFGFDRVGNMQYRERFRPWVVNPDGSFHGTATELVREEFVYDSLDRLTGSTLYRDGAVEDTRSYGYNRLGNMIHKDAGDNTYSYSGCQAGPHAVCGVGGTNFSYDANGNLIETHGAKVRTLEYSTFNKPLRMTEGDAEVEFTYGADRSRLRKSATDQDGNSISTWYVGLGGDGQPLYELNEKVTEEGTVREHLHFIYAGGYHGGQPFAVRIEEERVDDDPATPNLTDSLGNRYYHRDHLGSVIAVTQDLAGMSTEDGDVRVHLMSFDAFGKRRKPDWSPAGEDGPDQYSEGSPGNLDYTGQEAVPEVGLIHMNGRIYDPELGRFFGADPHIQSAGLSQNYNRYSYVLNNPLRYTDPTGYKYFKKIHKSALYGVDISGSLWHTEKYLMQRTSPQLAQVVSFALAFIPYFGPLASAHFSAVYAMHNGATDQQILFSAAVSYVSGAAGGAMASGAGLTTRAATGQLVLSTAGKVVAGAIGGALGGALHTARYGGNMGRAMIEGAARGAASAAITVAIQTAARGGMQPDGNNSGRTGDPGDRVVGDRQDGGNLRKASSLEVNQADANRQARLEYARSLTDPYVSGYNRNHPNFHDYNVGPDFVCFDCSVVIASDFAQAESIPLMLSPINQSGHGNASPGLQPIINIRPADNITVNITREGHWFHEGSVVHATFRHDGAVWLYTRGVGIGANPSINAGIGHVLFGKMHSDVKGHFNASTQY